MGLPQNLPGFISHISSLYSRMCISPILAHSFSCTDIASEKAPAEAANFPHDNLKHVETKETNALPSSAGKSNLNFIYS